MSRDISITKVCSDLLKHQEFIFYGSHFLLIVGSTMIYRNLSRLPSAWLENGQEHSSSAEMIFVTEQRWTYHICFHRQRVSALPFLKYKRREIFLSDAHGWLVLCMYPTDTSQVSQHNGNISKHMFVCLHDWHVRTGWKNFFGIY